MSFRKTWKSKFFGDNRFNFYGWLFVGLGATCASVLMFYWSQSVLFRAIAPTPEQGGDHVSSPEGFVLLAIWFLLGAIFVILAAHFALALQNYHSRVARVLEEADAQKQPELPLPPGSERVQ